MIIHSIGSLYVGTCCLSNSLVVIDKGNDAQVLLLPVRTKGKAGRMLLVDIGYKAYLLAPYPIDAGTIDVVVDVVTEQGGTIQLNTDDAILKYPKLQLPVEVG